MDPRHQVALPGQGHENQVPAEDLFSLPIQESEISVLGGIPQGRGFEDFALATEAPVRQRTWFKACVAIGDDNGHVGLGVKCSKEAAAAIRGAVVLAKLSIVPGGEATGDEVGKPHTVPCKVTGRCGSVLGRLAPAPRALASSRPLRPNSCCR